MLICPAVTDRQTDRRVDHKIHNIPHTYRGEVQRQRHGFESGGQILRAKRAEFFDPHFLASGGTKYGVDISVKAW